MDHLGTGLAAVEEFARDVRSFDDGAFAGERAVAAMSLFSNLATQRRLNALFLGLAAQCVGADLEPVATVFRRVSQHWNRAFYGLLFAMRAGRPLGAVLREYARGLDDLIAQEHAAVLDLRRRIAS